MFNYSRKGYESSPAYKLKDVLVPISDAFDKKWRVYSTNPKGAKKLLDTKTELYDLLLNNTRLTFVLYDYDRIVFGGDYGQFKLSEGSLEEATHLLREGCAVIAGVGNAEGGGHLLVLADYDPLTGKYLILDSAGNYDHWSGSFFSWQSVRENRLELNPDVYLTTFRAIRPL